MCINDTLYLVNTLSLYNLLENSVWFQSCSCFLLIIVRNPTIDVVSGERKTKVNMTTKFNIAKFFFFERMTLNCGESKWRLSWYNKIVYALRGEVNMSTSMSHNKKADMINKARNIVILCLNDKTLRKVIKENIVVLL